MDGKSLSTYSYNIFLFHIKNKMIVSCDDLLLAAYTFHCHQIQEKTSMY